MFLTAASFLPAGTSLVCWCTQYQNTQPLVQLFGTGWRWYADAEIWHLFWHAGLLKNKLIRYDILQEYQEMKTAKARVTSSISAINAHLTNKWKGTSHQMKMDKHTKVVPGQKYINGINGYISRLWRNSRWKDKLCFSWKVTLRSSFKELKNKLYFKAELG